jgi:hypothetical protein
MVKRTDLTRQRKHPVRFLNPTPAGAERDPGRLRRDKKVIRILKWVSGILAFLLLVVAIAVPNSIQIALALSSMLARQLVPIGPNQDITWSSGADPRGHAPQERPPNIVLILADDLGWNDLTFNGGGVAGGTVPTPHMDSIAAEGVNFTSGYAANGTCAPSRAALMSGRYGTRFGFEFTPTPPGMMRLGALAPTPPGRLRPNLGNLEAEVVPFARGEAAGVPHDALFWRSGASQSALVDGWKLNVSDPPGRHWLFDLRADPTEQHDLSMKRPEKLAELLAALAAHNATQAEPLWASQLSVANNIDKDITQPDAPDDDYIYWSN